jgi:hypothetical protein
MGSADLHTCLWKSLSTGSGSRKRPIPSIINSLPLKTIWHIYPAQPAIIKVVNKARPDRSPAVGPSSFPYP